MILTFLNHQWIAFWRSKNKNSAIAAQLILAFIALYLILTSIYIGSQAEVLITYFLPGKDPILVFNGFILYYFVADFLMRIQMQELPTLAVVPYLHLNIPKRKLVNFLNLRALFSVFNLFPILLFFPFCIMKINSTYGHTVGLVYLLTILSITLFNNYAALYFKRVAAQNFKLIIGGLLLLAVFGALEYFKVFSVSALSNSVFQLITVYPLTGVIFIAAAAGIYLLNSSFLRGNLYLEELKAAEKKKLATDYPFLDRFGEAGTLVALEIKLILRNKRPRSTVSKGLLFLCYGLLMYKARILDADKFALMLFPAIFMTGNMTLLYGQFMFSWQSSEFDGLMANKTDIKTFFKAKFIMLTIASTLLTILASFYGFLSLKALAVQFAAYFYNIGISTIIVLYIANNNYKYIDLGKGSSFNWQGVGTTSMLMSLPVFASPYLIYIPLSMLFNPYWGLAGITVAGIVGLLTRNFWIGVLAERFKEKKYTIAAGFRERT